MNTTSSLGSTTKTEHQALLEWTKKMVELCRPDEVHWCDGSQEEADRAVAGAIEGPPL